MYRAVQRASPRASLQRGHGWYNHSMSLPQCNVIAKPQKVVRVLALTTVHAHMPAAPPAISRRATSMLCERPRCWGGRVAFHSSCSTNGTEWTLIPSQKRTMIALHSRAKAAGAVGRVEVHHLDRRVYKYTVSRSYAQKLMAEYGSRCTIVAPLPFHKAARPSLRTIAENACRRLGGCTAPDGPPAPLAANPCTYMSK